MSTTTEQPKTELIKVDMKAPVATGTNVQALLEQYKRAFEIAAPQHLDVNRVMRVAIMTVSRNRDLLECTASSLLGAFMLSVQLGLDIGSKECHLVPFKNKWTGQKEVQLIPDYRGVAKLIRNTGTVTNIRANVVYKQDFFHYEEGLSPKLEHRPNFNHDYKDEDIIGAYSVAHFKEGYVEGHFVPRKYLERVRNLAKSKTGPWVEHFAEMCRKTALKHHSKTLPQSVEIATVVDLDNRAELAKPQSINLLHDPATGRLLAEIPPEEAGESSDASDLTDRQPEKSKLDTIVDANKKPDSAAATSGQGGSQQSHGTAAPAADPTCDRSDFEQLEILGTECGITPKKWRTHIEKTMGISSWDLLPKSRLQEARAWIEANKKPE